MAEDDGNIYWPPDETIAMSVWGFPEMADSTINVEIDGEVSIKIASLPGLFILEIGRLERPTPGRLERRIRYGFAHEKLSGYKYRKSC